MSAVRRNDILIILSIISRAFYAVYLDGKLKEKERQMHLKLFYGDIANKRD
jgi:hypothetical protein